MPEDTQDAFDKRITPWRADRAAQSLRGIIAAPHYVAGTKMQIIAPAAPIHRAPDRTAPQETQALFGEIFTLYDVCDGWGWGQLATDGYVGYVAMASLERHHHPATHMVGALRTYRYGAPDIKSVPLGLISMNAQICKTADSGKFIQEAYGGFVIATHLTKATAPSFYAGDPVAAAEVFLETPYLWGGRTSLGLDCSALIQNAHAASGHHLPRDSDQQCQYWECHGTVLFSDKGAAKSWQALDLVRGDLIYWHGHVAMMVDAQTMIHANATHMKVSLDTARSFAGAVAAEAGNVTLVVRPDMQERR